MPRYEIYSTSKPNVYAVEDTLTGRRVGLGNFKDAIRRATELEILARRPSTGK